MTVLPTGIAADLNQPSRYFLPSSSAVGLGPFSADTAAPHIPPRAYATVVHRVGTYELKIPLSVIVEPDDESFIAKCPDLPQLFGSATEAAEAVESLKTEIASLWEDLSSGDDFSEEFLAVKRFLAKCIG
jgi:hypothetical protein